jgi:hypothetical protein
MQTVLGGSRDYDFEVKRPSNLHAGFRPGPIPSTACTASEATQLSSVCACLPALLALRDSGDRSWDIPYFLGFCDLVVCSHNSIGAFCGRGNSLIVMPKQVCVDGLMLVGSSRLDGLEPGAV